MAGALYARDARGRLFFANFGRGELGVFDSTGRFLRTLGRPGGGPGEFQAIWRLLVAPGDTLRVFDAGNARESVYSPDLRLVRVVPAPGRWSSIVLLPGNRLAVNMVSAEPALAGLPLHVLDSARRIVRSFGTDEPFFRRGFESVLQRALAPAPGGGVYALHSRQYVLEEWDTSGVMRRELRRDVPWFKLNLGERKPGRDPPEPSSRQGLLRDARGNLWVMVNVPDRNWKRAIRSGGDDHITITDYNRYYETVIEVIDPRRARVIASLRVDPIMLSFVGGLFTVSWREDDDGVPHLDVWKVALKGP